jgi:hypothetical protein
MVVTILNSLFLLGATIDTARPKRQKMIISAADSKR